MSSMNEMKSKSCVDIEDDIDGVSKGSTFEAMRKTEVCCMS